MTVAESLNTRLSEVAALRVAVLVADSVRLRVSAEETTAVITFEVASVNVSDSLNV